jgi:hypothetical protein
MEGGRQNPLLLSERRGPHARIAVSDWAKEAEPYVLGQIVGAVDVAAHGATLEDRAAAAKIVHSLVGVFFHDRVDETLATKIASVLRHRIDEPQVVRQFLRTLIIGCSNHDKLAPGVERLAEQAAERNLRESLCLFVCGIRGVFPDPEVCAAIRSISGGGLPLVVADPPTATS